MSSQTKISIVVPVYYNELNIPDTVPQLLGLEAAFGGKTLELVFVDDGSGDRSLELLLECQKKNPSQIKVVKLTRNFGSMAAIQAGLSVATGDCVGMISADLQDPPELFVKMVEHWETGIKAVFAVRSDREESRGQKFLSNFYYYLLRKLAIADYPEGGFDYFLIDRQIVKELIRINEKNTNLMSLIFWLGHERMMIPYVRKGREKGTSRWTLSKKMKLFLDSFIAFTNVPLRALAILGPIIALLSFAYGGVVFFTWLVYGVEVKGFTAIMLWLTFSTGVQLTMLGGLGEYLWRTLDETRKRPHYVIDKVFDRE